MRKDTEQSFGVDLNTFKKEIEALIKELGRTPGPGDYLTKKGSAYKEWQIRKTFGGWWAAMKFCGYKRPSRANEKPPALSIEEHVKITSLKSELEMTKKLLGEAQKEILGSEAIRGLIGSLGTHTSSAPGWLSDPIKHRGTSGIPMLHLSDWHFDEVVKPEQIQGINEYNRDIAIARLRHTFKTTVSLLKYSFIEPKYDGIVVALNGDMLSGNIHEELAETNEARIAQSIFILADELKAGIGLLADEFGKVFVPCTVGNHGRMHKKPRAKNRVFDNYEWIIYQILARDFKSDQRVSFLIPEGPTAQYSVCGVRYIQEHGDNYQGGSGISGILAPLLLAVHRKQRKQSAMGMPFDFMLIAHFHQYMHIESGLLVNGSGKGYDEWAASKNFNPEPPKQGLWINHPSSIKITHRMPILCDSYKQEKKLTKSNITIW